ncbi:MAG: sigma-54-dependent Fis family transcriptional regulator [Deltaproteobacteria bacterium]|nr:sigma-54-dependent Fis family transcriptional regulator [Deltaproteobacteria bacterium]
MARVLVVDDDPNFLRLVTEHLRADGHDVVQATNGVEGLARYSPEIECVVSDVQMPEMDGLELLQSLRGRNPQLPVIMVTAQSTLDSAVQALRHGARDYILKPTDLQRLATAVRNAVAHRRLETRVDQLETAAGERFSFRNIVGRSRAMNEVFQALERVVSSSVTVMVSGESGTGKELLAKAIHFNSARSKGPFIAVNCAAIPENLIESELFGHEKGAFTGAIARRIGKVEAAAGGTLFLDEIGEMDLNLQAKLLRVLQERTFERVGGAETVKADVRVVAATHRRLDDMVREGTFREDLFYRLNVFPIRVPPLRERREDIVPLAGHFLAKFNREEGRLIRGISPDAIELLQSHDYPGNVRELENHVYRSALMARGEYITAADVPPFGQMAAPGGVVPAPAVAASAAGTGWTRERFPTLEQLERQACEKALELCGRNVAEAATLLGIGKATLYRKVKEYGLKA